jgi:hypothetical protein
VHLDGGGSTGVTVENALVTTASVLSEAGEPAERPIGDALVMASQDQRPEAPRSPLKWVKLSG